MPGYAEWIELLANFTIKSFSVYTYNSNSLHYLVGFWAQLTLAIPYMKNTAPSFLEMFIPKVTQALLSSRLEAVERAVMSGDLDGARVHARACEPSPWPTQCAEVFGEPDLSDQLKHLPTLWCVHQHAALAQSAADARPCTQSLPVPANRQLDQAAHDGAHGQLQGCRLSRGCGADRTAAQAAMQSQPVAPKAIATIEAQLALLVYYIGAIVGARRSAPPRPAWITVRRRLPAPIRLGAGAHVPGAECTSSARCAVPR
jgi:hypothetical protein